MEMIIALLSTVVLSNFWYSLPSCATSIGSEVDSLHQCSKYHFEEKVLDKVIRMDVKMEMFERTIKKCEDELKSVLSMLKERNTDVLKTIQSVKAESGNVLDNLRTEAAGVLANLKTETEKVFVDVSNKQDSLNSSMQSIVKGLETRINDKLTALSVKEKSLEANYKQMMNKSIGFSAYRNSSQEIKTNKPVIFDKVWTNKGNAYDPTSGIFTAPHSGLFHVSAVVMTSGDAALYFHIYHNDVKRSGTWTTSSGYKGWTLDLILDLEVGDRVYISTQSGRTLHSDGSNYVTFSGHSIS